MNEYIFGEKIDKRIVVCLGYFDSVHLGHIAILNEAKILAKKTNSQTAVFTFRKGYSANLGNHGDVFTFDERKDKFAYNGVENCIYCDVTDEFINTLPDSFLDKLFSSAEIAGVVTGRDYTYGKGASGNSETLAKYCEIRNVVYRCVDDVKYNGEKISSSQIKRCLQTGNIEEANAMLGSKYFIKSKVIEGRKVGRQIGFPTLNMEVDNDKCPLKPGVYYTQVIIDGKNYKCITNYGNCPTFGVEKFTVETHILGFDGNLYGEIITVYFNRFLREIKKFGSVEELKLQLNTDKEKTND